MASKLLALLTGDHLKAADLYFQEGKLEKAAASYAKAGRHDQAAELWARLGLVSQAVEAYAAAGLHQEAGKLLVAEGKHKDAVAVFEEGGAFWQAADAAQRSQQHLRAARLFERAGDLPRTAQCLERAEAYEELIQVLERRSGELEREALSGTRTDVHNTRRQIDIKRAELLEKIGRTEEAARLFSRLGETVRAAALMEKAGVIDEAIRTYFEAGDTGNAHRLLERAENLDDALRARILFQAGEHLQAGEIFERLGSYGEAADCFEAGSDWARAAQLWERHGDAARAADLFYRARQFAEAARCYEGAGASADAARAFVQAEEPRRAAVSYLKAEEPLEAARLFLEAGDAAAASDALQEVGTDHPEYENASLMLVPILIEDGLAGGALHRLRLLDETVGLDSEHTEERLYWEGRAHEELEEWSAVRAAYQKILALDRSFRDVTERLENAREKTDASSSGITPMSMTVSGMDLVPGQVLAGRYEIVEELGRGGMGRVYKARDRELDEVVAIKMLLTSDRGQADEERLLREVQICRKITHRNVVRVYDLGRFPGGIFVTMEYLEGHSLDRYIAQGALPLSQVRILVSEIARGLREAHRLKIIHRDLKPQNIILADRTIKILDFGIARMEGNVNLTQTGLVVGSPKYMSPEQIQGQEIDARSDLYSLGVLAFTMVAGREPFVGDSAAAIVLKHLQDPAPDPRELRADLPQPWNDFLERSLRKDPDERFQSAGEMSRAARDLPVEEG